MPRPSLDGCRTHLIISRNQDKLLRGLAKRTGMTLSEHIRRAIDSYLANIAHGEQRRTS